MGQNIKSCNLHSHFLVSLCNIWPLPWQTLFMFLGLSVVIHWSAYWDDVTAPNELHMSVNVFFFFLIIVLINSYSLNLSCPLNLYFSKMTLTFTFLLLGLKVSPPMCCPKYCTSVMPICHLHSLTVRLTTNSLSRICDRSARCSSQTELNTAIYFR